MEPSDQYLCIVPKQTAAGADRVQLPFEGDGSLAIILSKAFLLASARSPNESSMWLLAAEVIGENPSS